MIVIAHRRNTAEELEATPERHGIEVDIRSRGDELIIHHDAFVDGERFEDWLIAFRHRTLILNVKEEGLERRLLNLMMARSIEDFFFLDQSFPYLIKTSRAGEQRCAVRVSEYEGIDTALLLAGKVRWVWVDCFNPGLWMTGDEARRLQAAGFRLCLVSPELQGRRTPLDLQAVKDRLREEGIAMDAVCTKVAAQWE